MPPASSRHLIYITISREDLQRPEASSSEKKTTFECSLDGAGFSLCKSGQSYSDLSAGSHRFEVRAVDAAGNIDPTPAIFDWTVQ